MASTRFQAAIARATRSASTSARQLPTPPSPSAPSSPSSSDLSSPPSSSASEAEIVSDDEPAKKSKYFAKSKKTAAKPRTSKAPPKKRLKVENPDLLKIKQEPPIKPEHEPLPSLGDIPELKKELPPVDGPADGKAPANWERMYQLVKEMRLENPAPVDTMGCDELADRKLEPKVQRFQTLVSLMLSSQTKDTVTSAVVRKMQETLPGGLTLQSIRDIDELELDKIISPVGFHTRKAGYIKKTAEILNEQYGGDIPRTAEGLMSLPGVGPKMAYLCLSSAWNDVQGIGVDVHVHRITNLWGWAEGKTPEQTRKELETWLPRDKWKEVNWLLVGFGQTTCLPRGRRCGECKLEKEGLCRAAWTEAGGGRGSREGKIKRGGGGMKKEEEDAIKEEELDADGNEVTGEGLAKRRPRRKVTKVKREFKEESGSEQDIEDVPV